MRPERSERLKLSGAASSGSAHDGKIDRGIPVGQVYHQEFSLRRTRGLAQGTVDPDSSFWRRVPNDDFPVSDTARERSLGRSEVQVRGLTLSAKGD